MNNTYGEASSKLYNDYSSVNEIRSLITENAETRVADNYLVNLKDPKTALILPPIIYGKGNGPVNQRSIQVPELSRVAIQTRQTVQVGKGESAWSNIHISDLGAVFGKLVEKAVEGAEGDLWNENGLYLVGNAEILVSSFTTSQSLIQLADSYQSFGKISQLVAQAAHGLGLAESSVKSVTAAEADGLTGKGSVFWGTNARQTSDRSAKLLGWTQKSHSLEQEIPLTVKAEATRLGVL